MPHDATLQYPPFAASTGPLTDDEHAELVTLIDKYGLSGAARRLEMSRMTIAHLAARAACRDGSFLLFRHRLFEAKFRGEFEG